MTQTPIERFILREPIVSIESLGNAGGFSGAQLWKCETNSQTYCLRRWPRSSPPLERLKFIHQYMRWLSDQGLDFVPMLLPSTENQSYVRHEQCLWELSEWMPGSADFWRLPSTAKLVAAVKALAEVHAVTLKNPIWSSVGQSAGLQNRIEQLTVFVRQDSTPVRKSIDDRYGAPFAKLCEEILNSANRLCHACLASISPFAKVELPIFPCLKDIWHDHVLFAGDRVTGIIDFGAVNFECPWIDLARLLGSLAMDSVSDWHMGLDTYSQTNNHIPINKEVTLVLDFANVVLSGINWIRWIFEEGRRFENMAAVESRLAFFQRRLNNRIRIDKWTV